MTRHRVDRLMFSLTTMVAIATGISSFLTQNPLYLPQIAIPIVLWFRLRRTTPIIGKLTKTIEGDSHVIILLCWLSLLLAIAMLLFALDYRIMGHLIHDPVKPYHWVALVLLSAILLTGVAFIERSKKRASKRMTDEQSDGHQAADRLL